jgi:hypothetical protein
MEEQPASRSAVNNSYHEIEFGDDDFDDERAPGVPCTQDGQPLLDQAAAQGQVFVASALTAALQDPVAPKPVEAPSPKTKLDWALKHLYHPQLEKQAEGVYFLAERTALPPAGRHASQQELKAAGEARVAAFGHVTKLIMLLESDVKQVPGLLPTGAAALLHNSSSRPAHRVTHQHCPAATPTICIDHKLVSAHSAVANCVAINSKFCAGVVLHASVTGVLVC